MASKKPASFKTAEKKDEKCLSSEPSTDKNAVSERVNKLFSVTLAELRDASSSKKYAAEANANRKLLRQALDLMHTIFLTFFIWKNVVFFFVLYSWHLGTDPDVDADPRVRTFHLQIRILFF
jgi:hypothetical protein